MLSDDRSARAFFETRSTESEATCPEDSHRVSMGAKTICVIICTYLLILTAHYWDGASEPRSPDWKVRSLEEDECVIYTSLEGKRMKLCPPEISVIPVDDPSKAGYSVRTTEDGVVKTIKFDSWEDLLESNLLDSVWISEELAD